LVISEEGYWVKFEVRQVPATRAQPHGLKYPLTLHNLRNQRFIGFDNAHAVTKKRNVPHDHKHFHKTVKPYEYANAAALLADFWAAVDAMREKIGWR
jgi:hypothetical protein